MSIDATKPQFEIGDNVQDDVSLFHGKIMAMTYYLYDPPQALVTATDNDGGDLKEHWFSLSRLRKV